MVSKVRRESGIVSSRPRSTLGEMALQRVETALEDISGHSPGDLVPLVGRGVECGGPDSEGPVPVRDLLQPERGDVVGDRRGVIDDRIGDQMFGVGKGDQPFAYDRARGHLEPPHGADLGRGLAVLDLALDHARVPGGQAVEVTYACPDLLHRRIYDA